MPELPAGQPQDVDASADAPVAPEADIEKIKAEFKAELDSRVAGFQRLIAERDVKLNAVNRELEELKTSGLSEDEREQLAQDRLQKENDELRSQLELQQLAGNYGDEMESYRRLLAADTAEAQLQVLRELRQPAPAQGDPAPAPAPEIPDTDPNRPLRAAQAGTLLSDGTVMTDALADRILGSVGKLADVTQRRLRPTD